MYGRSHREASDGRRGRHRTLPTVDLAVQRDTEAQARYGRLAPGNSEAAADNFRSGPGCGWRPSPDGPVRRGGALLCRGGGTLMRGVARAPGGLLSCPCLPGWLECFPWPLVVGSDSAAAAAQGRGLPAVLTRGCSERNGAGAGVRGGVPTLTGALEKTLGL
ncbi:hypothetical protein NDU88_005683 [Pleurodeles waltl]|uniref:Uncharacterized protein n=1 Tax=Pleurodeles waltl TaxID=8319 RepID=A0AAV7MAP9_PLEWA|nr:hypothetical protein NDU88_005683 [Pleurodeles waltl]